MNREIKRFWGHVDVRLPEECWPWRGAPDVWGYGRFKEKIDGEWISTLAHRRMYRNVYGAHLSPDVKVLHSCDNPICVNPSHLRPGTDADNATDKKQRGRCNPPRKLTKEEVVEIFFDIRPYKEISAQYGVNVSIVSAIKVRIKHTSTTEHIKGDPPRRKRPSRMTQSEIDRRYRQRQRERKSLTWNAQQGAIPTKKDEK